MDRSEIEGILREHHPRDTQEELAVLFRSIEARLEELVRGI